MCYWPLRVKQNITRYRAPGFDPLRCREDFFDVTEIGALQEVVKRIELLKIDHRLAMVSLIPVKARGRSCGRREMHRAPNAVPRHRRLPAG